ncbi:UvrD-helicase domain-containing protein [Parabacteroides sp. ZJ-118]|uniref:UvrD-helicase domain-containing protein n=1 Tax=Parabacteroides sp. ZJ-118 TaxID=2709398 RepID=UPI0013E9E6DD|nr:UvrD-helicase domain-containing protein [Parabacteroides sp. ZJ-118]
MSFDTLTPDESQRGILDLSAERTAVVRGVAGSGKSFLLFKKAKKVSVKSNSYAIIVYTKSLKQFFIDELKEIDPSGKHVYHYAEWQRSSKPNYTYLFIDECQDFSADEIEDFKSHGTYCWFFGDSEQSIMRFRNSNVQSVESTAKQMGVHPKDLALNHRLTFENAKVGEFIKSSIRLSLACVNHGDKPRLEKVEENIYVVATANAIPQLDRIIQIRNSGGLTKIGILVYYNDSVEIIRDYFLSKGIPVEWKTRDDMEIDFKSSNPVIITWHCSKGLEFEHVFIPFCGIGEHGEVRKYAHPVDPILDRESAIYVATTRPIKNLYLLYTDNLSPKLPSEDSDVYMGEDDVLPL